MKILHCISSVNPAGGGPIEGIKQLASVLTSQGHLVEVASLDAPSSEHLAAFPLRVYPLGPKTLSYGFSPRLVPWLRKHAPLYDVVVVNGLWQYNSLGVWMALHRTTTPYVVFTHGMLDPWFKRQYPLKHLKKCLYWPWGQYPVLRDASAVLFTSEEERMAARDSFRLYRCHEKVVNYGTAGPVGDAKQQVAEFFCRFPQLQSKRLALFMGRIHPKKGCDLLIEAFAKTLAADPEWRLVMAGPDQVQWRHHLEKLAQDLNVLEKICWTGMLKDDVKWGAFRSSEIFVLPSHQENFGIVVAEALACGVPVLISDKVNIWREVQMDRAGLVAADDLGGTTQLLRTWAEMQSHQKDEMKNSAVRCFRSRFEIHQAAQSVARVFENVRFAE